MRRWELQFRVAEGWTLTGVVPAMTEKEALSEAAAMLCCLFYISAIPCLLSCREVADA